MTAELHGAFVWDCDACGAENFERAIIGNLDEAAMQAIIDSESQPAVRLTAPEARISETDPECFEACVLVSEILLAPKHVTCAECGTVFESEIPTPGEEGGDDEPQ